MSFAVSSLQGALGVPSTRVPISVTAFVSYIVPPVVCYIAVAVLAITPQTRTVRAALWPVLTLSAFRAAVSVDMSGGNPDLKFFNMDFVLGMAFMAIHSLPWSLAKEPLVRYLRPVNSPPSTIMDALDLATSFRGHGWEWSRGLYLPRETRPTNRIAFACYALLSGATHGIISGALYTAIEAFTAVHGSTIFDDTLPFLMRYLRANVIATLGAFSVYSVLQMTYDLFTVPAVLLLGQGPAQWPPAFDSPWCATSLNEFWSRRWHQMFRRTFILGAYPLTALFGRAGTVIGAFISSGLHHHLMMITVDNQSKMWRMLVPFGMMAPGIFAERAFYRSTGRKVGGVVGWVWTMAWLLLWGNVLVDEFARVGMFASLGTIESWVPLRARVQKLVIDFDAWLHTI